MISFSHLAHVAESNSSTATTIIEQNCRIFYISVGLGRRDGGNREGGKGGEGRERERERERERKQRRETITRKRAPIHRYLSHLTRNINHTEGWMEMRHEEEAWGAFANRT